MSEKPADEERQLSIDRETIQMWSDDHDVVPVRDTAEGTDRIRLVSEADVESTHERLEWDAFFEAFEEGDYVVIYHEAEATDPLEVAKRNDAVTRSTMAADEFEQRLIEGETVTTEITETTVVESVIVEELTVESELVDTDVLEERVVDAELVGRECTNCTFVDDREVDHLELFDADRYVGTFGATMAGPGTGEAETTDERRTGETGTIDVEGEFPYHAELDVDETWTVTRELLEQFTVESHISGTEVTEADTIEDHEIDVEGLHQSIVESGVIDVKGSPDEVLTHYDVESELAEDDRIQSYFNRERLVEDEVVDRKRLRADVTGGELLEMERLETRDVMAEAEPAATEEITLTGKEVGKTVVDAGGDEIGTVTDVEQDRNVMLVDPHHSITERVMAALGWGDEEDEYPLRAEHVQRVDDDRVELKGREELTRTE